MKRNSVASTAPINYGFYSNLATQIGKTTYILFFLKTMLQVILNAALNLQTQQQVAPVQLLQVRT